MKSKKCSDTEITKLLNSDTAEGLKVPIVKLMKLNLNDEDTKEGLSIYSKAHNDKTLLSESNVQEEKEFSLKMKLRRCVEQSTYKIDNSYYYERKGVVKDKKENNDPLETNVEDNQSQRVSGRIRNRPIRFSDYTYTASPRINSPRLRSCKDKEYSKEKSLNTQVLCTNELNESPNKTLQCNKRNFTSTKKCESVNNKASKLIHILSEASRTAEINSIVDTPRKSVKRLSRIRFMTISDSDEEDECKNVSKRNIEKRKVMRAVQNYEKEILNEEKKDTVKSPRKKICNESKTTEVNVSTDAVCTPKSRAIKRYSSITPSMDRRTNSVIKPTTPLQHARSKLHVSIIPKSLPCREEEFNNIFTFLQGKLLDKCGGCIYISGVPGTGKTATVNEVIRCLKRSVAKGELEDFDFLEINGMKLTEPRQAYVHILKQITGNTCTWEKAYRDLDKRFTIKSSNKRMTLLLVDELDLLCTKRQDVVYNLLDWPMKASAQLVVITIANTMDLPERILMGRVTSRLGLTRLTFQPYNHKQLQEIVLTRLKNLGAFRSEAVQLVARKVAAVSGDARRALDICRRATEIAELHSREHVSMEDVNEALQEMISSAKVQAIIHCSQLEKIFLQAVCAEVARTGLEEACFKNVYYQLDSLCSFEGIKTPTITVTLGICERLTASRLLICEHTKMDIHRRILLNVSSDDVHFALQRIDFT